MKRFGLIMTIVASVAFLGALIDWEVAGLGTLDIRRPRRSR
jgi:hypothetical protein